MLLQVCRSYSDEGFGSGFVKNSDSDVYIATPDMVGDPDWYMDSGATNHVTHQDAPGTSGSSNIFVGNGSRLKIHKFASAIIGDNVAMNKILVVPEIKISS